ncbi:hypothetical protein Hesp01_74510 [Herbidospora sp. NBRC 101105]|nr:hypothetical protein [Herbidospora sp. NBRC 101105]GLX99501.1 hypothetical protein Hesp01_74510 [Herbidospora sp. NBRC 101105]
MGTVRFDDEEYGLPVQRLGDGDLGSAWADQFGRPFEDLAADDVEHHVDLADLPEIACIHEGTSAETEHDITI